MPLLELVRLRLRGLVHHIEKRKQAIVYPNFIDELGEMRELDLPQVGEVDFARFKRKARHFLREHEHAVKAGKFGELLDFIGWDASSLLKQIEAELDHEKRAAYLCLLTAACAAVDKAEIVGDISTGWIWLRPASVEPWAREALKSNRLTLA